MAIENTPWAVHAAAHSAQVARTANYANSSGAEGIVGVGDLRVRETQTPGPTVRVAPGAALLLNKYSGGAQQTYTGRIVSEEQVEVPASGSSGSKTWYICATVKDPEYPGTQMPDDPLTGQYFFLECLSSVPKNRPAIPLAKIVVPASTGTITNDMITDLREVANPRHDWAIFARPRVIADSSAGMNLTVKNDDGGEYFPGGDGSSNQFRTQIPTWATRVAITAQWSSVSYEGGKDLRGFYWVEFGDEYKDRGWPGKQQFEFATQKFAFNSPNTNDHKRGNWTLMDAVVIPQKLRGKNCTFAFKAGMTGETGVSMDEYTGVGMRLDFLETPDRADGVLTA